MEVFDVSLEVVKLSLTGVETTTEAVSTKTDEFMSELERIYREVFLIDRLYVSPGTVNVSNSRGRVVEVLRVILLIHKLEEVTASARADEILKILEDIYKRFSIDSEEALNKFPRVPLMMKDPFNPVD